VFVPEQLFDEWQDGTGLVLGVVSNDPQLRELAETHPETSFVVLDGAPFDGDPANITLVQFATHEGSYLAGAAAALSSRTGRVGFVGGVDIPLIHPFQAGFEAGVRDVDPDILVDSVYLTPAQDGSGFGSSTLAALAARDLYATGSDVVFHAAGQAGLGVFGAAAEHTAREGEQVWAIGVDADQYASVEAIAPPEVVEQWRPHILTSLVKRYDVVTDDVVTGYLDGSLEPGLRTYDVGDGAFELAATGGNLDPVRAELDRISREVAGGAVDVPAEPSGPVVLYQDTVGSRADRSL
jgi:basic membrane protein A